MVQKESALGAASHSKCKTTFLSTKGHCHCPTTYKGWECTARLGKSPALLKALLQRLSSAEQSQAEAREKNLLLEKKERLVSQKNADWCTEFKETELDWGYFPSILSTFMPPPPN